MSRIKHCTFALCLTIPIGIAACLLTLPQVLLSGRQVNPQSVTIPINDSIATKQWSITGEPPDSFHVANQLQTVGITLLSLGDESPWTSAHLFEAALLGTLGSENYNDLWTGNWAFTEEPSTLFYTNTQDLTTTIQVPIGAVTETITDAYQIYLPIVYGSGQWTDCSQSSFGTMLIHSEPNDWITPADVLIYANDQLGVKGMTGTGAPSELVRDEWFGRLPGWTRSFMRGTYDTLTTIHWAATVFGMEDMYECFAYGPESPHQAGEEALDPLYWVPQAEALAEAVGKCLIYAPAVRDYELLATPEGEEQPRDDLLANLITQVAPHVDIWIIQLAKYQFWVDNGHNDDGDPYTMDDFKSWVSWWVSWIKTANPNTKVWTQLGIGRFDPIQQVCLPPPPPEYILEYRETLIEAGVDGVWVMPAMPCQHSTDPQDHEYYLQYLTTFQEAIEMACGQ